jgi:broad specificity phosphatase PhoE
MEIYAIRHAQSTYNKWSLKRIYTPWLWGVRDPMIYDAPLSDKGLSQASKLQYSISDISKKVDLIICSPLTRAIHTMQIAFQGIECPVIVTPLARERGDKTCDIGIPFSKLREKYPQYEYLHFNNEHWWNCDQANPFEFLKETKESLRKRQAEFIEFLKSRTEKFVVVVSHGQFIKTLTGKKLQMRNCEVRCLSLEDISN